MIMHFFNRAALVTAVLVFCLSAAGCSDNDKDKNNSTNSKPAADKSSSQAAGQDSRTDSSAEDSSIKVLRRLPGRLPSRIAGRIVRLRTVPMPTRQSMRIIRQVLCLRQWRNALKSPIPIR